MKIVELKMDLNNNVIYLCDDGKERSAYFVKPIVGWLCVKSGYFTPEERVLEIKKTYDYYERVIAAYKNIPFYKRVFKPYPFTTFSDPKESFYNV